MQSGEDLSAAAEAEKSLVYLRGGERLARRSVWAMQSRRVKSSSTSHVGGGGGNFPDSVWRSGHWGRRRPLL